MRVSWEVPLSLSLHETALPCPVLDHHHYYSTVFHSYLRRIPPCPVSPHKLCGQEATQLSVCLSVCQTQLCGFACLPWLLLYSGRFYMALFFRFSSTVCFNGLADFALVKIRRVIEREGKVTAEKNKPLCRGVYNYSRTLCTASATPADAVTAKQHTHSFLVTMLTITRQFRRCTVSGTRRISVLFGSER